MAKRRRSNTLTETRRTRTSVEDKRKFILLGQ
jgi:hypothetical protein